MSKISPSPIREEYQRVASESSASRTARAAITAAINTTALTVPLEVIWLTTSPASSGVATPITDETMVRTRKTASSLR